MNEPPPQLASLSQDEKEQFVKKQWYSMSHEQQKPWHDAYEEQMATWTAECKKIKGEVARGMGADFVAREEEASSAGGGGQMETEGAGGFTAVNQ